MFKNFRFVNYENIQAQFHRKASQVVMKLHSGHVGILDQIGKVCSMQTSMTKL